MGVGTPSQYNCAEIPCCRTFLASRVRAVSPELPTRPLHARSSPRTRQIRDATAQTCLPTYRLQAMHRTRAAPVYPSTQPVAGANSPLWPTFGSQRTLDDRLGAGRAGFVVHTSRRRRVSPGPCSRSFVGGAIQPERACVASHATRQRVSLTPASRRAFCAEPSHRYRTVQ